MKKVLTLFLIFGCYAINTPAASAQSEQVFLVAQSKQESITQGIDEFKVGNYPKAIEWFNRYLGPIPHASDANIVNTRGTAYFRLGKIAEAKADFLRSIQLKANHLAYYNLGTLYRNEGQSQEALEAYNQALKLEPQYASALNNRGTVYLTLGRPDAALADFNAALKLTPKDPDAHNNRGYILLLQNKLSEALPEFDLAIQLSPQFALAYANKAELLYKQGHCQEAFPLIEKSCELGNTKACNVLKTLTCPDKEAE